MPTTELLDNPANPYYANCSNCVDFEVPQDEWGWTIGTCAECGGLVCEMHGSEHHSRAYGGHFLHDACTL